jgi:hypothetical protein
VNSVAATGYALVAVAVASLAWLRPEQPKAAAAPQAPAAAPPSAPSAEVAVGGAPRRGDEPAAAPASTATEGGSRELLLPDGSKALTLNGATDADPLATFWGPFPWSPIVGVERNDQGLDWYKHADGSYSTTQMVWRQDLGRHAAMTRVAHPGVAPPPLRH